MIGTFAAILIFTMFKEAWEVSYCWLLPFQDISRHKSDNELNNKKTLVFDHRERKFQPVTWSAVRMGQLLKIYKDEDFPCDIFLLKSARESGVAYVDTMQLDGETNLKEKIASKITAGLKEEDIRNLSGEVTCDSPNENLEEWDCNVNAYVNGP